MGMPRGLANRLNAPAVRRPAATALAAEYLRNSLLEIAGMEVSLFTGYCKRSRGLNAAEFRRVASPAPADAAARRTSSLFRRTASEGRPYNTGDIKSPLHFGGGAN